MSLLLVQRATHTSRLPVNGVTATAAEGQQYQHVKRGTAASVRDQLPGLCPSLISNTLKKYELLNKGNELLPEGY